MQYKGRYNVGDPSPEKRFLYAEIDGKGTPTIVIEVGGMMPGTHDPGWLSIRGILSQGATVFCYDRANLGLSDPAPKPRSLAEFAGDLHSVLRAAQSVPPYLLVGCSLGGMIVTHFASLYPQDVCGMVLLDSPHPEVNLGTLALLPAETPDEPKALADFRKIAWQEQFAPLEASESEVLDYPASIAQANADWNLRDIPLVVLTAGIDEWDPGFPSEVAQAYEALWLKMQKKYASLSTQSRHIIVEDSDHLIHEHRPDVVVDAVRQLLEQCRTPGSSQTRDSHADHHH